MQVPVLDPIASPVVTLSETQASPLTLVDNITCTDPDGDVTRIYLSSVTPINPCGNCFPLWPCVSGYCLMFVPGLDTLSYSVVPSYVMRVSCTDDIESDVSTRLIEVRLTPNTPPVFTDPAAGFASITVTSTNTKGAGDAIYDVEAEDADNDAIFYTMSSQPNSDAFEIGYGTGEIRAAKDLRVLCDVHSVTFTVYLADSKHSSVGPAIVEAVLDGRNERPVVTNVQTVVDTPENTSFTVSATDANGDALAYSLTSPSSLGTDYYGIDATGTITSLQTLDYEVTDMRSVILDVGVTDGFCDTQIYSVTMRLTDVNEAPVISPDYVESTVYEGDLSFYPGWTVSDPDETDSRSWQLVSGGDGRFYMDAFSGQLHSTDDLDVDPNTEQVTYTLNVSVTDKGSLQDTASIRLTVQDSNDNAPVFTQELWKIGANPCTSPGRVLETLLATDSDSAFQGNNDLVYSGTGSSVSVLPSGDVIYLGQCTVGETKAVQAHVADQGVHPAPLTGSPATVLFTCNECPVPETTAINTPPAAVATTVAATVVGGSNVSDFLTLNIGWVVVAALLTMLLAGLASCMMWKCCRRMRARCRARRNPTPRKPVTQQPEAPPALRKPDVTVIPPPSPPSDGEPVLFGFWKETYSDRDQRSTPKRDGNPATVEEDLRVEDMEKAEQGKEREQRRLEKEKEAAEYRKKLENYRQNGSVKGTPLPPPSSSSLPAKRGGACVIL